MDRKKVCEKSSAKKKMMSIELKREIIEKHEQGVRVVDLSRQYGRSTSMICTVLKQKESIKGVTPAKGLTIISKLRTSLHENMEKLLMVLGIEKQLQGDTLTQTIICKKARAIYGDLLKQTPQTSIDEASEESFKASRGWFENFKKEDQYSLRCQAW
ncbi:tigger transposable element-derived protein 1 [Nephila pilipes]|uniref:Tigger transposable element-derived protein 1 n=1 Tax=Nephila pilipes TaxID=299642 RepID=A0A8X6PHU7_NEPPI|nr:tigger transposable element-derived protein 1 [Nephila pilipes]